MIKEHKAILLLGSVADIHIVNIHIAVGYDLCCAFRGQTSGEWSCMHMKTKKAVLRGSYPRLDFAPIVSPQNKDVCGDRYTPDVECKYTVHGPEKTFVYLEFLTLDLDKDCSQDSLQVRSKKKQKRFCGSRVGKRSSPKFLVLEHNRAEVVFKSNYDYACRGFSGFMVVFTPGSGFLDNLRKS